MRVMVVDSKLHKHSLDVDETASVTSIKSLLSSMCLVPPGCIPALVYDKRVLNDSCSLRSIAYRSDRSISLIFVRAASALTADSNTGVASHHAPLHVIAQVTATAATPENIAPAPPPPAPPSINFATEWVCERGKIWPKAVDYAIHCPKRHMLTSCRTLPLCHACGNDACCGGGSSCTQGCLYAVCAACLIVLQQPRVIAAAKGVCGGFPSLGVSAGFLQAFRSKWQHVIQGWTTEQVCQQLVKALTSRSGGSMCDQLHASGSGDVGEANLFLSHTWGDVFLHTVDAALQAAAAASGAVYIWIDVFSTSQHTALDIPSSDWMRVFRQAIEKMGSVAMVLHPWNDPAALKRAW